VAGVGYARKALFTRGRETFLEQEPGYWGLHWKYSRWVLITAVVYQLTTQGYYWLVAGFLSVKDVGELRAMYNLIAPADQFFIAMFSLVLPAMSARYVRKGVDNLLWLWKRVALAVLTGSLLFAFGVRIVGKQLMHGLYAGRFDGLESLLFALAFFPFLMTIGNTTALALNASERPKLVLYGYLAAGTATFVIGIPLVIRLGLRGAVYGLLVSGTVFSVATGISFLLGLHNERLKQAA
jgi:O-antigen/teichoic acid export membrane protein